MDTLVSIIVPIYKVEKYIKKCINTIINQTYRNLEIILVDDGSVDNCPQICDDYAKMDTRIKVIHKENGGLSDARNVGIHNSSGEYICFIDSDDYVELNMVEKALGKALKTKADVVVFSLYNEVLIENDNIINKEAVFIDPNNLTLMISIIGYAWNKLYKASFIKSNKFTFQKGLSLVEDIVFNEKVLINTNRIEYLNTPLYHYINRNRTTLVKQYHEDSYKLHKLGFQARKNLMFKLFGINNRSKMIIAGAHISGIRYCCSNMFYYKNNLTLKNKYINIKNMLYDEVTVGEIKLYMPKSKLDKLVKAIIQYKIPLMLCAIYHIRSVLILNKQLLNKKKIGD